MSSDVLTSPLFLAATAFAALGTITVLTGLLALLRARPLRFMLRTLSGLLLLALGAMAGGIVIGMQGYEALTRETVAARISVLPTAPQRFTATFRFADGRQEKFELAGDEIYVEAHILKWKPLANMLGLHTAYELDRVAGRYHGIDQERNAPRTICALGQERKIDLFTLRHRYAMLSMLFDADYGSASFVPVTRSEDLELRVSTTGLLLRSAAPAAK